MQDVVLFPAITFLIWRFLILIFQIFIEPLYLVSSSSQTLIQRIFTSWVLYWDAGHYLSIALHGYKFPQQAFFPLWSLFIKLVTFTSISGEAASYLLTFVFNLLNF